MGIRQQLAAARVAAGLSQETLAERAGWDRGQVSKFESGKGGASVKKIDAYLAALGARVVADGTAAPPAPAPEAALLESIKALPEERRALLLRLVPLLGCPEVVTADRFDDLVGLVERWDRQRLSPTIQDSRASTS